MGTPKQQAWIHHYKNQIARGIILAVGFAFDVNAGTKPDAPAWMQRFGLTWVFRLLSEPRRLGPRYLQWNCLFLFYLAWDGLRGRAWAKA
jgi:N-acetylglucosaminyldiphosphoundecaprenol N-acetyl-beta-D-mannosaminyltransferase